MPPEAPDDDDTPRDGHDAAALPSRVYDELRALAGKYLRNERLGHTLQATALVNEAWLRMGARDLVDREHFLAVGAQAMRRILVEHARRRNRIRRGGGQWHRITLDEPLTPGGTRDFDLVEMNDLLNALAAIDARAAQVVELRFFGGLTIGETARVLGVSSGTVDNDWFAAKAWLSRELRQGGRG